MKIIITEERLQSIFNGMMSEFSDLSEHQREYDFFDNKRGSYIDYGPINFYNNKDFDDDFDGWWEDDNWILQYAEDSPYKEPVEGFQTPLLIYSRYFFKGMLGMFGDKFKDLLKFWFELTYGYPVKQVIDDYESSDFLDF